jgi:hypothetical protein
MRDIHEGGCVCGSVRYRTFDNPDWLQIRRHIWTRSAQRWTVIPADVECFDKGAPV